MIRRQRIYQLGAALTASLMLASMAQVGAGAAPLADPGVTVDPTPAPAPAPEAEDCTPAPGADCAGAVLAGRDLGGKDLTGVNLENANLDGADISSAILRDAKLTNANLSFVKGSAADLSNATATSTSFSGALLRGVSAPSLDAPWASFANADLTGAVLPDAQLGKVTALNADFTDAQMQRVDLGSANLDGARFVRTDLTSADLRSASLWGAKIDSTTILTDADLTGATWIDGRTCLEGSVGRCIPAPVEGPTAEAPGISGSTIGSLLKGAFEVYKFASTCKANMEAGGSCFDAAWKKDFNKVQADIAEIRDLVIKNHEETMRAMNVIIAKIEEAKVREEYKAIQKTLSLSSDAMRKYLEYTNCLAYLNKQEGAACVTTDINGNNPKTLTPKTVADLWDGTNKPLADMAYGGPVARLLHSTLYRIGGSDLARQKLVDTGNDLLTGITGTKAPVATGLLPAHFSLLNAQLTQQYSGTPGALPRFIPGRYTQQMNALTKYYTGAEAEYFATVIASLQLLEQGKSSDTAESLLAMAEKGVASDRDLALDKQIEAFTFDVDAMAQANPDRVGYFLGADGRVYRVQQGYPGNTAGVAASTYVNAAGFPYPSYATLQLFQNALQGWGVRMSTVQDKNPATVPSGSRNATWWANFGGEYKTFYVRDKRWNPWSFVDVVFRSGSAAPDYGFWGSNVATKTYHSCVMPVRMRDAKVSMAESFADDSRGDISLSGKRNWSSVMSQVYVDGTRRKKFLVLHSASERDYNRVVHNGAIPAYDVGYTFRESGPSGNDPQGTGTWYRCDGGYNSYIARPLSTDYVSLVPLAQIKGAFKLFGLTAEVFETCADLHDAVWSGIGRRGAVDEVADDTEALEINSDEFRIDSTWYDANSALDADGDGIACELTDETTP